MPRGPNETNDFNALEKEFWTTMAILALAESEGDITVEDMMSVFKRIFAQNAVSHVGYRDPKKP